MHKGFCVAPHTAQGNSFPYNTDHTCWALSNHSKLISLVFHSVLA